MFNWFKARNTGAETNQRDQMSLIDLHELCKKSGDFVSFQPINSEICVSYYNTLVNKKVINKDILAYLDLHKGLTLEQLIEKIPIERPVLTEDVQSMKEKLLIGYVMIFYPEQPSKAILLPASEKKQRQISFPEAEYTVVGPKEGFVESIETNINLIRKRLPIPELIIEETTAGTFTKTKIAVVYIDGVANEENVNTVTQRIKGISYDQIIDISYIAQMIEDNNNSVFPQMIDTERPDRVAAILSEGKIAILCDGSPYALTGPTTLIEFFASFEDYFLSWHIASVFRLIRLFAVTFSVFSTPLYVAVLTFHYEMIPENLLYTLISSRSGIPFPPIMEAIILELTIELLREAGSRLPSKVGQTIGIVGGIVIGTAAVDAGLTSNVLLIIVALAALSSFTTPVYKMSNTIRLLRFPFLLMAQLLGMLGIAVCFCFILIHLLKLTSLGRPYIGPIYPLRVRDLKDALFRLPFDTQNLRPFEVRSPHPSRPPIKKEKDIDE
ncbi:spore germination protein [Peribacillus kribbensis]|uniref:spore germination protein n=1 Tax=Peribacillus kribbensis TaxID=356658 RepID=UPI0003FAE783|nr:spore germination protein [Peribacillus kribbensis]